jgi:hypothetical protein
MLVLYVTYVYELKRVSSKITRGGGGAGIILKGQLGYRMGLEWIGFRTHAIKATTSTKS